MNLQINLNKEVKNIDDVKTSITAYLKRKLDFNHNLSIELTNRLQNLILKDVVVTHAKRGGIDNPFSETHVELIFDDNGNELLLGIIGEDWGTPTPEVKFVPRYELIDNIDGGYEIFSDAYLEADTLIYSDEENELDIFFDDINFIGVVLEYIDDIVNYAVKDTITSLTDVFANYQVKVLNIDGHALNFEILKNSDILLKDSLLINL